MHNDLISRIEKKITRTINQKHAYDFDGTGIGWNKFENNPVLNTVGAYLTHLFDELMESI